MLRDVSLSDGKFILELASARENENGRTAWVAVPRKTFWPPTAPPFTNNYSNCNKNESSTSLSCKCKNHTQNVKYHTCAQSIPTSQRVSYFHNCIALQLSSGRVPHSRLTYTQSQVQLFALLLYSLPTHILFFFYCYVFVCVCVGEIIMISASIPYHNHGTDYHKVMLLRCNGK